jgi:hypothetical protein
VRRASLVSVPRLAAAWTGASAVVVGAGGAGSRLEVAGDDDADRLDPAGDVEHGIETALGDDVVLFVGGPPLPRRSVLSGLLEPEELEALVVVLVGAGHRREIVAASAAEA